jgi:hypothetical protein
MPCCIMLAVAAAWLLEMPVEAPVLPLRAAPAPASTQDRCSFPLPCPSRSCCALPLPLLLQRLASPGILVGEFGIAGLAAACLFLV